MQFSCHLLKRVQKAYEFQVVPHVSFALFRALADRSLGLRRVGNYLFGVSKACWVNPLHLPVSPKLCRHRWSAKSCPGTETWSYSVWCKNCRIQGTSIEQFDLAFQLLTETLSGSRKGSLQGGKV